jgi:hypothetical protein
MSRLRPLLPLLVLAGAVLAAGFKTVDYLDGDAVMTKVHGTHSSDAEIDVIEMVSVTNNDKTNTTETTTRRILSAVQNDSKGGLLYLMRILSPEDEKGVSLLVLEDANDNVDQYLYIPALGAKKIDPSSRSSSFLGSDFTYEDLRREKPGEWKYDRLDDEKIDGTDCYAIMATPADKNRERITGYTYRFLDVDKATFDIRRIVFLDSKQKELKVFDAYDYEPTNTAVQRPRSGVMTNLVKGTHTIMTLINSRLGKPLDESVFTLDTLKNWGPDQDKLIEDLVPKADAKAP